MGRFQICLVGEENHLPYQRPPLSKGFLNGSTGSERLYLKKIEFFQENSIQLNLGVTANKIDRDNCIVHLPDDKTIGYDKLVLATGSRVRKLNFVTDTVKFYLEEKIPPLGEDLLHVGSLLGQMGANSMTDGIYSQHGRLIKSLNKYVFDQTTVTAFPGSSGGGVYLKSDARYIGMLVRGAGEGFNLIVPVRRMQDYCEKHKIMWALDPNVKMPDEDELKKMPVEHEPKEEKETTADEVEAKKMFPFMLRITPRHQMLILK